MGFVDIILYLSYLLVVTGGLLAVIMPFVRFVKYPQNWQRITIAVGGIVVLFFVSYGLASDTVFPAVEKYGVSPAASRLVGATLILMYTTMLLLIIGIVYTEIVRLIRS